VDKSSLCLYDEWIGVKSTGKALFSVRFKEMEIYWRKEEMSAIHSLCILKTLADLFRMLLHMCTMGADNLLNGTIFVKWCPK